MTRIAFIVAGSKVFMKNLSGMHGYAPRYQSPISL